MNATNVLQSLHILKRYLKRHVESDHEGMKVPDILLSGNFPKIEDWRSEKALERTKQIRPDLLDD